MATFHPSENLLVEYSAGTLDWGLGIMVATHISMCSECQAKLRTLECVGGVMISNSESSAVSTDSFDQVMDKIRGLGKVNLDNKSLEYSEALNAFEKIDNDLSHVNNRQNHGTQSDRNTYEAYENSTAESTMQHSSAAHDVIDSQQRENRSQVPYSQYSNTQYPKNTTNKLPAIVRKLLPSDKKLSWKRISSSLSESQLNTNQDKYKICFHKIKRGGRVIEHDHNGIEVTIVLNGSFSDEAGTYMPGDFIVQHPGNVHRPMATQNEDCLCLSLTDSPVKVTGLLGKVINPFLPFRPA